MSFLRCVARQCHKQLAMFYVYINGYRKLPFQKNALIKKTIWRVIKNSNDISHCLVTWQHDKVVWGNMVLWLRVLKEGYMLHDGVWSTWAQVGWRWAQVLCQGTEYLTRGDNSHSHFSYKLVTDMEEKLYNVWVHLDRDDARTNWWLCGISLLKFGARIWVGFEILVLESIVHRVYMLEPSIQFHCSIQMFRCLWYK